MKRIILALLGCLCITSASVGAQFDSIEAVEAEGLKHLIHYDGGTDTYLTDTRSMLGGAVTACAELWEGALIPPVVVDLLPPPAVDVTGDPLGGLHAVRRMTAAMPFEMPDDAPTDVCYIGVYTDLALPPTDYSFELAREIAQCYLFYNVPAASEPEFYFMAGHDWWGEGGSLWMAYHLYGGLAPDMGKAARAVTEHMGESLVKQGDGAYYFWAHAAGTLGEAAVITLLTGMPDDINAHHAYLDDNLPPDADTFMQGYAAALAKAVLPVAPPAEDLFRSVTVRTYPGRAKPAAQPFGVDLLRVNVQGLGDDEGVTLDTTELTTSGLTITTLDGLSLTEADSPVKLCESDGKVFLVASRALKGRDIDPPHPANIKFDLVECDEETAAEPGTEGGHTGFVPECVVGRWQVIEMPYTAAMDNVSMGGAMYLSVDAEGNTTTTYENFTQSIPMENLGGASDPLSLVINGTATGKVAIDEAGFVVDSGEVSHNITATANLGGMSMDMSRMVRDFLVIGAGMPADAQFTCYGTDQLVMLIVAGDFAGEIVMTRA
jgi:hypothetical protein